MQHLLMLHEWADTEVTDGTEDRHKVEVFYFLWVSKHLRHALGESGAGACGRWVSQARPRLSPSRTGLRESPARERDGAALRIRNRGVSAILSSRAHGIRTN
ncbi:unnamed protein product, partial [Iphiclides podalirius]